MSEKWRLSDVFNAIVRDESADTKQREAAAAVRIFAVEDSAIGAGRTPLRDDNVGEWLGHWDSCAVALGRDVATWRSLTAEQRCDFLVAEARRLNVPRRA